MSVSDTKQIEQFISSLESALNAHDAAAYNRYFAEDISWGNPNGGVLRGLKPLHAVHKNFLEGPLRSSRFKYTLERAELLGADIAYAQFGLLELPLMALRWNRTNAACMCLFENKTAGGFAQATIPAFSQARILSERPVPAERPNNAMHATCEDARA